MKHLSIAIAATLFGLSSVFPGVRAAEKFDCAKPENIEVAQTLKPLIEKAKLCKGFRKKVDAGLFKVKIKIDQTKSVRVEDISYCTSQTSRKIEGTVAVECETDEDEEVQINVAESFAVAIEIGNDTCAVTRFSIEPEGDIGKLIAKNIDFEEKVRRAVEKEIAKACDGPS